MLLKETKVIPRQFILIFSAVICLLSFASKQEESYNFQFKGDLIPYRKGDSWGFVDKAEQIVIPATYEYVDFFRDELAIVRLGKRSGVIDKKGNIVVPIQYENLDTFRNGLAWFGNKPYPNLHPKYGVVNKSGEEIIPAKYDEPIKFFNGVAKVMLKEVTPQRISEKYGLVNTQGQEIAEMKYDEISGFDGNLALVKIGSKYGMINKRGEEVMPLVYDAVEHIHMSPYEIDNRGNIIVSGLIAVKYGGHKVGKWGFIDTSGKEIIPFKYDRVYPFKNGMARISLNKQWGFINREGEEIIPPQFDMANDFANDIAVVKMDNKYAYVDRRGKVLTPFKYDEVKDFEEEVGLVIIRALNGYGKYGFVNIKGEEVIPLIYDYASQFENGMARVGISKSIPNSGRNWGFINTKGEEIITIKYDGIETFQNGLARVKINGKYGYINESETVVIEPKYKKASSFFYNFALVWNANDLMNIIDKEGNELFTFEYNLLSPERNGLISVYEMSPFRERLLGFMNWEGKQYFEK